MRATYVFLAIAALLVGLALSVACSSSSAQNFTADGGGGGSSGGGTYPCCATPDPTSRDGGVILSACSAPDASPTLVACHAQTGGCVTGGMAGTLTTCPTCEGLYRLAAPPPAAPAPGEANGCAGGPSYYGNGMFAGSTPYAVVGTNGAVCVCASGTQCGKTNEGDAAAVECL